jgi:hypothetical protein
MRENARDKFHIDTEELWFPGVYGQPVSKPLDKKKWAPKRVRLWFSGRNRCPRGIGWHRNLWCGWPGSSPRRIVSVVTPGVFWWVPASALRRHTFAFASVSPASDSLVDRNWELVILMRALPLERCLQSEQVVVGQRAGSPSSLDLGVRLVAQVEEHVATLALRKVQCLLRTLLGDSAFTKRSFLLGRWREVGAGAGALSP